MAEPELIIQVDSCQLPCRGQQISGDLFVSRQLDQGARIVSVLADGLGCGVEAAALASVTAAMAQEYVAWNIDTGKAASILMDSLPVEATRQISYSSFTLVDAQVDGRTRIFEHGNPPCLLVRAGQTLPLERRELSQPRWGQRVLQVSECQTRSGDRILVWSDGVTQSGQGCQPRPPGGGEAEAQAFVLQALARSPELSARQLSELIVDWAVVRDGGTPGDDLSCSVIAFRPPRRLLILTGPPYDQSRDPEFARLLETPGARKIICGGTTAAIIGRERNREALPDRSGYDREVPQASRMEGAELVTEGCLTLGKVAALLESGVPAGQRNAATAMVELLLDSDLISFQVGTRVNAAHQDPSLPVELDIRRNVIKRIQALLESTFLKQVSITYY